MWLCKEWAGKPTSRATTNGWISHSSRGAFFLMVVIRLRGYERILADGIKVFEKEDIFFFFSIIILFYFYF